MPAFDAAGVSAVRGQMDPLSGDPDGLHGERRSVVHADRQEVYEPLTTGEVLRHGGSPGVGCVALSCLRQYQTRPDSTNTYREVTTTVRLTFVR